MADDVNQQGALDRSRVAADEGYEVAYFARKHGLSQAAARELIKTIGNDRAKLDEAAQALSAGKEAKRGAATRSRSGGAAHARSTSKRTTRRAASDTKRRPLSRGVSRPASAETSALLPAVIDPVKAGARKIGRDVASAAGAVTDRAKPAARRIATTTADAVTAVRRSSADARRRAAAAPAALRASSSKALAATRTAATSPAALLVGAAAAGLVTGLVVNLARKAVVQAPSIIAGDWLEALKAEHRLALSLIGQLQDTSVEEPARREALLMQLTHALGKHAFAEENVVYPALRDWGDKADADKLNHDHGYVKQHLYELDALDNRSPEFLERVVALQADLEAHIREEEDAIFPPLHASLDDGKNAHLTALLNKEGFKLA